MEIETLPMILSPKQVSDALGISLAQSYRLFHSKKFPSEKVQNKMLIPKPRFLKWLGMDETAGLLQEEIKDSKKLPLVG